MEAYLWQSWVEEKVVYLSELDLFELIHAYALVPADLLSYVIILACKKQENAI